MSISTLSEYGYSYQCKLIISLLTDSQFTQQTLDIIEPEYFDSEANRWIIKTFSDYYKKYKALPTLEALKMIIHDLDDDVLKVSIVENLKEAYKQLEATDLEIVKEKTLIFCQNQAIKQAVLESADLLEQGKYDDIRSVIDKALKAGQNRSIGHDYKEEVVNRFRQAARDCIPLPWPLITDITDGGAGKGEMFIFVAPSGVGKSWLLSNIGAYAILNNYNVIHYTLELGEEYTGKRYDSIISGIAAQELKYHEEEVIKKVQDIKGNLVVKYFPTKTASVITISAHIEKCILNGFKPDLIIVDYADLLKPQGSMAKRELRHALGNIYEELRGLAGEYQIPIFSASQSNRSSETDDIVTGNQISESYEKLMISDVVISLSRKVEDKVAGTGRFFIIKNRFGPDGIEYPAKMNASNGRVQIFESNSSNGLKTRREINDSTNVLKQVLTKRYEELL